MTHCAHFLVPATITIAAAALAGCGSARGDASGPAGGSATRPAEQSPQESSPTLGAALALDDATEEALLAALDDERRAEALYLAVMERFGEVRPFSNIVVAEERHQTLLLPLLEKYGVPVPPNPYGPLQMDTPDTLAGACQLGVQSEIENIAMYDRLLPAVQEDDIRSAFELLRRASAERHLPAFERCADRAGGGRGRGAP